MSSPESETVGFAMPEIGVPGNIRQTWHRLNNKVVLEAASSDPNPDLEFPESALVFKQMSRTDGQVGSVMRAITNSILKAAWDLDEGECRPDVIQFVRDNIGLPAEGAVLPRARLSNVVWSDHLRDALTCLVYGFAVFEQTYVGSAGFVWLRKLAPRIQTTISRIEVERDGGLEAVWQYVNPESDGTQAQMTGAGYVNEVRIPKDRVAVYSFDREGGDWYGTSVLRTAYKHWRINDVVLRLAAQIIERNGMGIPGMEYDGTLVTKREAEQAVAEWRAGATAGLVYPKGAMPVLRGVEGATPDPMPLIKYNDEAIGRSVLAMFLNLGHDNGARSLGDTFVDAFTDSLQAVADFVAATATEFIIRDLVELNWGPDEPYPSLTPGSLASQALITPADLKTLVDAGLVTPDPATQDWTRSKWGLPEPDPVYQAMDQAATVAGYEAAINPPEPDPTAPIVDETGAAMLADMDAVTAALSERVGRYVARISRSPR